MNKQELLGIIFDLPSKQRELLAAEIYRSLDAANDDFNAAWIVEANRYMLGIEDTPPDVPEDKDFTNGNNDALKLLASTEGPGYETIEDVWEHIDQLRVNLTPVVRLRQ